MSSFGSVLLQLALGVLAGIIVATLGLVMFDGEKLQRRLADRLGIVVRRRFTRIDKRSEVIATFNRLFISNQVGDGGRILLMSNTGGYPEFDPFPCLVELSGHRRLEIIAAVSQQNVSAYFESRPDVLRAIAAAPNLRLFAFDDLTPYKFRIGVNTDINDGFFCVYHGHEDNRVSVEGIASRNPLFLEAVEAMFQGLLTRGTEITPGALERMK